MNQRERRWWRHWERCTPDMQAVIARRLLSLLDRTERSIMRLGDPVYGAYERQELCQKISSCVKSKMRTVWHCGKVWRPSLHESWREDFPEGEANE